MKTSSCRRSPCSPTLLARQASRAVALSPARTHSCSLVELYQRHIESTVSEAPAPDHSPWKSLRVASQQKPFERRMDSVWYLCMTNQRSFSG